MGNWFSDLPAPTRWSSIVGGSLLSTFAEKLPEWLQDAGLYVGIFVLAYGMFATLWHMLKLRGVGLLSSLLISAGLFLIFGGVLIHLSVWPEVTAHASSTPRVVVNRPKPTAIEATKGRVTFDYSTNNGVVTVGQGDCRFGVHFSKASDTSIYVYRGAGGTRAVARIKGAVSGDIVRFQDHDSSSRVYSVNLGEHFLLENAKGCFMQGKIISIKDDSRGAPNDEVVFDYEINTEGTAEFAAL